PMDVAVWYSYDVPLPWGPYMCCRIGAPLRVPHCYVHRAPWREPEVVGFVCVIACHREEAVGATEERRRRKSVDRRGDRSMRKPSDYRVRMGPQIGCAAKQKHESVGSECK